MKITYITHSCMFIETDGLKIITDPWLVSPCWGGDLWHFPKNNFNPDNLPTPNIIFFTWARRSSSRRVSKKFSKVMEERKNSGTKFQY